MLSKIIRNFVAKMVAGRADDGIMITLKDPKKVEFQGRMLEDLLMRNGIDPNAIKSEQQLKNILNQIKAAEAQRIRNLDVSGIRNTESAKVFDLKGRRIKDTDNIMGGEEMPPPGSRGGPDDIAAPVQSAEESLRNMNLDELADIAADIKANIEKSNKKNIAAMKKRKMLDEAIDNVSPSLTGDRKYDADIVAADLAERMGLVYDDMPTKERLKLYEEAYTGLTKKKFDPPEDLATGGRVGYKIGSLDKARRAFLKKVAGIGGGIAALKTGLLGLSKKAPEATEKVMENFSTTLSEAPDYFFNLVSKIKMFGKKSKIGPQERVDEYSYVGKNGDQYTLTEDIVTGDAQIIKDKMGVGSYGDKTFDTINDRTVMEYKSPRQDFDVETGRGTRDSAEYEEYKVEFDSDGTEAGADAIDEIVQKEIIEEATDKAPSIKKAGGGLAYMLGE